MRDRALSRSGFTIIEVMVAVLILAVSVVSIFGAQFATVATVDFARYTTHAVQLARCKMSEIELQFLVEQGFEVGNVEGSGACCEMMEGEDEADGFKCSWEIQAVEIPDISTLLSGGGADGGMLDDFEVGSTESEDMGMGMMAAFAPMVSEVLKEAIRRVTVTVEWDQGSKHRQFVLSQYVTHPTQGPLDLMHKAAAADEAMEEQAYPGEDQGAQGGYGPGPRRLDENVQN